MSDLLDFYMPYTFLPFVSLAVFRKLYRVVHKKIYDEDASKLLNS